MSLGEKVRAGPEEQMIPDLLSEMQREAGDRLAGGEGNEPVQSGAALTKHRKRGP